MESVSKQISHNNRLDTKNDDDHNAAVDTNQIRDDHKKVRRFIGEDYNPDYEIEVSNRVPNFNYSDY